MTKDDPYQILEIDRLATSGDVQKAFRKLAKKYHPDRHGGDASKFIELKKAYEQALKLASSGPVTSDKKTESNSYISDYDWSKIYGNHNFSFSTNYSKQEAAKPSTGYYDPFADLMYERRNFFHPSDPKIEGFERKMRARAKDCRNCSGNGTITKNIDPKKGFLGLEKRLCKCQWL